MGCFGTTIGQRLDPLNRDYSPSPTFAFADPQCRSILKVDTTGTDDAPYVEGEVLVRFKRGATETIRGSVRSTVSAHRVRRLGRSLEHLRLGRGRTTRDAVERLRRHPDVEFAEPNYLVSIDKLPDDLRFVELYGLMNTGQTGGDPDSDIDAELAWDLTTMPPSPIFSIRR